MTDLNPAPLISLATSYWNSATLIAAIKLGVFDAISQGSHTPKNISSVIGADEGATLDRRAAVAR